MRNLLSSFAMGMERNASRSDKFEGSSKGVHFKMVVIDKFIEWFQIKDHPVSCILFRANGGE